MVVKNLKVIASADLNADGTFNIGLRDTLLINKDSKVSLDKFVYKQKTQGNVDYKTDKALPFSLTPDLRGTIGKSLPTPARALSFPAGKYPTLTSVLAAIQTAMVNSLTTGLVKDGKKTMTEYFKQISLNPTNDAGLDISCRIDAKSGNIVLYFSSYKLQELIEPIFVGNCEVVAYKGLYDIHAFTLSEEDAFYYGSINVCVKSGFQMKVIVANPGDTYGFYIGLRSSQNVVADNYAPVDIGLHHDTNGLLTFFDGSEVIAPVAHTLVPDDEIIMFVQAGDVFMQILNVERIVQWTSDPIKSFKLGDVFTAFRAVICSDLSIGTTNPPIFAGFSVTNVLGEAGTSRQIKLDFADAGSLSNELGFASSDLIGDYGIEYQFYGVQQPNFYDLQDVSIYWSLPMQTFVGSADRKRNAREQLVGSFTPTRAIDRYDSLSYNSALPYTSIGNNQEMNISALNFRVINEYTGKALPASYLSFNLLIKDKED